MAGSTLSFTTFTNALNKVILPAIQQQIYAKAPMWKTFGGWDSETAVAKRINVPGVRFENNTVYVTIKNSHSSGVVSLGAVGNNLVNGFPGLDQGSLSITTSTGSFLIPKQVMNVNQGKGAIVSSMQFYSEDLGKSMASDLNRQCYGDGSGALGVVSTTGSNTVNFAFSPSPNGDIPFAKKYLAPNMLVQIGTTTYTVSTVTGNLTFTLSAVATLAAGLTISKIDGSSTIASELLGLVTMMGTTTSTSPYIGISPSTDPSWQANGNYNGGTATVFKMTDLNQIYLQSALTGDPKLIVMNVTEYQKYAELVAGGTASANLYRFQGDDTIFGGWGGLAYMGGKAMVVMDNDCPDDKIFVLSPDYLWTAEFQPLQTEQGTDGQALRVSGSLNYEVVADWMGNIGTNLRSAHGLLASRVG